MGVRGVSLGITAGRALEFAGGITAGVTPPTGGGLFVAIVGGKAGGVVGVGGDFL